MSDSRTKLVFLVVEVKLSDPQAYVPDMSTISGAVSAALADQDRQDDSDAFLWGEVRAYPSIEMLVFDAHDPDVRAGWAAATPTPWPGELP